MSHNTVYTSCLNGAIYFPHKTHSSYLALRNTGQHGTLCLGGAIQRAKPATKDTKSTTTMSHVCEQTANTRTYSY